MNKLVEVIIDLNLYHCLYCKKKYTEDCPMKTNIQLDYDFCSRFERERKEAIHEQPALL